MDWMWMLACAVLPVVLIGGFIAMQVSMIRRMSRMEGQAAPELDGAHGEAVASSGPSLFYFYSPQCGACRPMTPIIAEMTRASDRVHPVNIAEDMQTARKFGVMATPAVVVTRGGIVDKVLIGPQDRSTLQGLLADSWEEAPT